ncbi:molybdopterin-dependent oxidoreductase [Schlesneria paludicola]|uniref:molybdopterin-dependent oxidoreductase n=1 Tax=Schlesneria paludicola TaxID=360056 RepID=UPI00029A8046|nr:molybdopterin-dependent oxidoreductase [Schlesneria paludicola]
MLSRQLSRRRFIGQGSIGILALTIGTRTARSQQAPPAVADLITRQITPFNAEPPLPKLIENWITPVNSFFVRSHGTVPSLDAKELTLTVDGLVERSLTFRLAELLERFPAATTTATITCAGNRRAEFAAIKKVGGVQWDAGAIGNAEWQGVRLVDVLKLAGIKSGARHVWFEGQDEVTEKDNKFPFGGSIPLEKALDESLTGASLLATRMNGKPLTPDHGFPLRTIVPGFIGARSVKWLNRITVADRPSPNHFVADVYKVVPEENAELIAKTTPIYEFMLNSAICVPAAGATVAGHSLNVKGFALTNGTKGRKVQQIDVSADGGMTWKAAKVTSPVRDFCWVLWTADVPVTATTSSLLVRATDSSGEVQPEKCPWNYKGYQFNGWHKINVKQS